MSDVTINKGQVMTWLQSPKVQAVIRAALAPSGVVGIRLVQWKFPEADIGPLTDIVVQGLPFALVLAWSLAVKTHDAIINKAAQLIAAGKGSEQAKATVAVAIANDNTTAAVKAA